MLSEAWVELSPAHCDQKVKTKTTKRKMTTKTRRATPRGRTGVRGGRGGGRGGLECSVLRDGSACEEIEHSMKHACTSIMFINAYNTLMKIHVYVCTYIQKITLPYVTLHNITEHNITYIIIHNYILNAYMHRYIH